MKQANLEELIKQAQQIIRALQSDEKICQLAAENPIAALKQLGIQIDLEKKD